MSEQRTDALSSPEDAKPPQEVTGRETSAAPADPAGLPEPTTMPEATPTSAATTEEGEPPSSSPVTEPAEHPAAEPSAAPADDAATPAAAPEQASPGGAPPPSAEGDPSPSPAEAAGDASSEQGPELEPPAPAEDREKLEALADCARLRQESARLQDRLARQSKELEGIRNELRKANDAQQHAQQELSTSRSRIEELTNRLLRAAADFENFRRRAKRDQEDARKFGTEALLKDLLPVLDNLDRAMEAAQEETPLVIGIRMVQKQFLDALARHGLQGFDSEGKPFDPARHEAMDMAERSDVPAGTVVQVYQKGYLLHERLIRPALVIVSKLPPQPEQPAPEPVVPVEAEPAPAVPDGQAAAPGEAGDGARPEAAAEPTGPEPPVAAATTDTAEADRSGAAAGQSDTVPTDDPRPRVEPAGGAAAQEPRIARTMAPLEVAGIIVGPAERSTLEALKLDGGVEVLELKVPSPGARTGLRKGDVVTGVGARTVQSPSEFVRAVRMALHQRKELKFRFVRAEGAEEEV